MTLTATDKERIKEAIQAAELLTSGEIQVFIEQNCAIDVLDRAAYQFKQLDMHKTAQRNGVLIYLALKDHKFAIIGDAGIHALTGPNFWNSTKETMVVLFKEGEVVKGLIAGIGMVGRALQEHFPRQADDKNELSDDVKFGEDMA